MFPTSKTLYRWLTVILISLLLTGCSLYRPDLRQGNFVSQSDLDKLEPGMTKREVQQIMGTTAENPMFLIDEWNYSYAYLDGSHRDQPLKFKTITLYFRDNKLVAYKSDTWKVPNLPRY